MALETKQRTFLTALTATPRTQVVPRELFREPPVGSIDARFSIYATGLVPRVVEALEDDYPALRRIVGQGPFRSLAARYIESHPSGSSDLGQVGAHLATFLRTDPLSEGLSFLSDLAELEWSLSLAFIAADAEPVTWGELQALGDESVVDLPMWLVPGHRVIRSRWPLVRLWHLKDVPDEDVDLSVEEKPNYILVRRRRFAVVPVDVDAPSARLVDHAGRNGSLAGLLDGAASGDQIDKTVSSFRGLVVDGVFSKQMVSGGLAPDSNE